MSSPDTGRVAGGAAGDVAGLGATPPGAPAPSLRGVGFCAPLDPCVLEESVIVVRFVVGMAWLSVDLSHCRSRPAFTATPLLCRACFSIQHTLRSSSAVTCGVNSCQSVTHIHRTLPFSQPPNKKKKSVLGQAKPKRKRWWTRKPGSGFVCKTTLWRLRVFD